MKILLISNNPLCKTGSNGRTMLNMLERFKKDDILNIFLSGNDIAVEKSSFYQVKDVNVLKNKTPYGKFVQGEEISNFNSYSKSNKGALKYLIRSIIWSKKSIKKELLRIAVHFNPDRIIIQCGDSDFLINISCWLSKKLLVPLISFNTEAYIFKEWDYFLKKKHRSFVFRLFFRRLLKSYNLLYKICDRFVYLTNDLKDLYERKYGPHYSYIIYNSSSLKGFDSYNKNGDVVYCGNLGLGREKTLVQLSEIIFSVLNKKIIVYSACNNETIIEELNRCEYINYMGSISYEKIADVYSKASFLLYCESFDEYYLHDSQYAFSTKIADMLRSGIPGIYVCPKGSTVYNYIAMNNSGITINNLTNAYDVLNSYAKNEAKLISISRNQLKLGFLNHNSKNNSELFYNILALGFKYTFQLLVTTVRKNFEQMIDLAKQMNIKSDAIIRSQCGYDDEKNILFNGYNLKLVCASDVGCSKNRNELLKLADSDYVLFSDDDQVFYDNYLRSILVALKCTKADYVDFSFNYDNGSSEIFKNRVTKSKRINTNLGVWNIVIKRAVLSDITFNEKIGPGCEIDNGEDNVFRYNLVHSKFVHATSSKNIFVIKDSSENSTCSQGEEFKKIRSRCFVYGYIHPIVYKLFLFRMFLQLKSKRNYKFKLLVKFAKEGKKERNAYFH